MRNRIRNATSRQNLNSQYRQKRLSKDEKIIIKITKRMNPETGSEMSSDS